MTLKAIYRCWNLIVNKEITYVIVNPTIVLTVSQIIYGKDFSFQKAFDMVKFVLLKSIPFVILKVIMRMKYKRLLVD